MSRFSDAITAIKQGLGDRLCIMGHHYQHDDVVRHCDVTGDSLELARRIEGIDAEHIVFCGVYFMGESAALLAKPGQSVHMPAWDANCMMSLMTPAGLARTVLLQLQATGRKIVPLAYVNTTLALKAVVGEFGGAVCTSANARTMLAWALEEAGPDGAVLFMPDKHLGRNTGLQLGLGPDDWHVLRLSGKTAWPRANAGPAVPPPAAACCSGRAAAPSTATCVPKACRPPGPPIPAAACWPIPNAVPSSSACATAPAPPPTSSRKRKRPPAKAAP